MLEPYKRTSSEMQTEHLESDYPAQSTSSHHNALEAYVVIPPENYADGITPAQQAESLSSAPRIFSFFRLPQPAQSRVLQLTRVNERKSSRTSTAELILKFTAIMRVMGDTHNIDDARKENSSEFSP